MPSRRDKRDSIALAAFLLGLQVEFVDGVDGAEIPLKAYPQVLLSSSTQLIRHLAHVKVGMEHEGASGNNRLLARPHGSISEVGILSHCNPWAVIDLSV